jgi:hypothetical protein
MQQGSHLQSEPNLNYDPYEFQTKNIIQPIANEVNENKETCTEDEFFIKLKTLENTRNIISDYGKVATQSHNKPFLTQQNQIFQTIFT